MIFDNLAIYCDWLMDQGILCDLLQLRINRNGNVAMVIPHKAHKTGIPSYLKHLDHSHSYGDNCDAYGDGVGEGDDVMNGDNEWGCGENGYSTGGGYGLGTDKGRL
jgi:hypothetical protein